MTSIAQKVWKNIEEDAVIRQAMEMKIISLKNLALHFIKTNKWNASSDAVISAIRRYKEERPLEKTQKSAKKEITRAKQLKITSNMAMITLEKNREVQLKLQKAFEYINVDSGEILHLTQGEQSLKLITNQRLEEKLLTIFPGKYVRSVRKNVAEINVHLSEEAATTPGILSVITTELMLHAISLVESVSCLPELLFFVDQKDVVKAYEVLFTLINET